MMKNHLVLFALLSLASISTQIHAQEDRQTVILVGIDGLRADAIDRANAPNMRALAARGVRAEGMTPAMPSKTFVNLYSLATGLHPKNHGIVSNYFYDRTIGREMDRSRDIQDARWWGGEPIWVTAEKQGVRTGTNTWLGAEAPVGGVQPTYWNPYTKSHKSKVYAARVDQVLEWLDLPDGKNIRLGTLYFSAVDDAAHQNHVNSPEELQAIEMMDKIMGRLVKGLKDRGLYERTNIIIVSDHGMTDLSPERIINLDTIMDVTPFITPDWNRSYGAAYLAFMNLYGDENAIEDAFQKLNGAHPHLKVLRRGAFPENYHFDHPDREPDLMLLADPGWVVYATEDKAPPPAYLPFLKATHGFDNLHPDMRATFIASGPSFKEGTVTKPFNNIEVYGIIACALDITPAKTDGNIANVQDMMTKSCK
ncbi:alkaline phosphatase family protein [Kordiimonas aquimaris]|uniref:alkaline phosphatase family protein n=1 Tax=Kordiimonas aquimaris TaxID=707591 RepID=UPI0021D010DB|nr:ectonucleotide pyrophosphatase/phosphodiesterase [Kordiimonas aquimaris]